MCENQYCSVKHNYEIRVKIKGKDIGVKQSWVEIFIHLLFVPGQNSKDTDGFEIVW